LPNGDVLVSSWNNSALLRFDNTGNQYLGVFSSADGLDHPNNLVLLNVPEPGAAMLLLGVAVILARGLHNPRKREGAREPCLNRFTS
jgi:hypothetical protein